MFEGSILLIAMKVCSKYLEQPIKSRHENSESMPYLTNFDAAHNILPRNCSPCGNKICDNSRAWHEKAEAEVYIVYCLQNGCGSRECYEKEFVSDIPTDPTVPHSCNDIRKPRKVHKNAPWVEYFLRKMETCTAVPQEVLVNCTGRNENTEIDDHPRWTSEANSRFLMRAWKCVNCENKIKRWSSVDKSIRYVN
jgi:hypothetical protein